jgi:hyperosmotically inducible protein
MKKLIAFCVLVAAALCVTTPAAWAERSAGEAIDDTTLQTSVKAALTGSDAVKARDINLETYKGQVQLSGFVDTAAEKDAAGKVAAGVEGVKSVDNSLVVSAPDRSVGQVLDDQTAETAIKTKLLGDEVAKGMSVSVEVRRGVALLSGFTDTAEQKTRAGELAGEVKNITDVRNAIIVKPAG